MNEHPERSTPERCPFCGFDIPQDANCQKCGQSRNLLKDAPLEVEVPCLKCGYALRGLRTLSPCPECGTSVYLSLYGDFLYHADGHWLRTVHTGVRMLEGVLVGLAAFVMGTFVLASVAGSDRQLFALGLTVLALIVATLSFLGWWRVTKRDEARFGGEKLRVFVRVLATATLVDALTLFGTMWLGWRWAYPTFGPASSGWATVWMTGATVIVIWPLRIVTGLYYLRRLCRRLPDADLVRTCGRLGIAAASAWGVSILVVFLAAVASGDAEPLLICGAICLGFGCLVWNGVYLVTLLSIGERIHAIRRSRSE